VDGTATVLVVVVGEEGVSMDVSDTAGCPSDSGIMDRDKREGVGRITRACTCA
jgi:hypothetical protein